MLTFDASVILVNSESWRTEFANRDVIFDNARCVVWTALAVARVDTAVVDAGLISGTATVFQAHRDAGFTLLVTHTDWLVLKYLARLSSWAGSWTAGVLASIVDACKVDRTFSITPA